MLEIEGIQPIHYLDAENNPKTINLAPGFSEGTQTLLNYSLESGSINELEVIKVAILSFYAQMNVSTRQAAKRMGVSKSSAQKYLTDSLEFLWQRAPDEIKDACEHDETVKLKDSSSVKQGKQYVSPEELSRNGRMKGPMSDEAKQHLRELMTQEERDRRSAISTAWNLAHPRKSISPEERRQKDILRARKNRQKKKLEAQRKSITTQPPKRIDENIEERNKLRESKLKLNKSKKQSSLPKSVPVSPENINIQSTFVVHLGQEPQVNDPKIKKPDMGIEDRIQNPLKGALRNLAFLENELPEDIQQGKVEWKSIYAKISYSPYFRFEKGLLHYVIPMEEGPDTEYIVSENLLVELWTGRGVNHADKESIIIFSRNSVEDIGVKLKNSLTGLQPNTEQSPKTP